MTEQESLERLKTLMTEPASISALQIPQNVVIDIALRLLYTEGLVNIRRVVSVMRVPLVVEQLLKMMTDEKLISVQASDSGMGFLGYLYRLTESGEKRAREALDRSQYIGPVPAPIQLYNEVIELQTSGHRGVTSEQVKTALLDMVLPDDFHRRIGPAVNTAASLFIYGPSGNGKSMIAKKIAQLISAGEPIWLPYAVTAGGQIIQIHDRLVHQHVEITREHTRKFGDLDTRFGLFERPAVVVGGEMKMSALDARYDPVSKIYEAPLQMKANGGMFLIDDFGRQQVRPEELLNRWIVPLEEQVDYLRLHTGQTVVVPFRELIVFSTNLEPYDLAEDAFFRRIQMKVKVESPIEGHFRRIFERNCKEFGILYDEEAFQYLVETYFLKVGRAFQAVHPRDLLTIIHALCQYEGREFKLANDLIDEACRGYFVQSRR